MAVYMRRFIRRFFMYKIIGRHGSEIILLTDDIIESKHLNFSFENNIVEVGNYGALDSIQLYDNACYIFSGRISESICNTLKKEIAKRKLLGNYEDEIIGKMCGILTKKYEYDIVVDSTTMSFDNKNKEIFFIYDKLCNYDFNIEEMNYRTLCKVYEDEIVDTKYFVGTDKNELYSVGCIMALMDSYILECRERKYMDYDLENLMVTFDKEYLKLFYFCKGGTVQMTRLPLKVTFSYFYNKDLENQMQYKTYDISNVSEEMKDNLILSTRYYEELN